MVSIIERLKYRDGLMENAKIKVFSQFICKQKVAESIEFKIQVDKFFLSCVQSFQNENKSEFLKNYGDFSRRKPSSDSSFIYDDYLIFALITCVCKFESDTKWLLEVLNERECTNSECTAITKTFLNILNNNFKDNSNTRSIIIVLEELLNKNFSIDEEVKAEYLKISNCTSLLYKDDILNLISYRAFDIIVTKANISGNEHSSFLIDFEKTFLKKIYRTSNVIYYTVCIGLIVTAAYYYITVKEVEDFFGKLDVFFAVLTVIGLGGIINEYFSKKKLTNSLSKLLRFFWGYNKN